jgi:hypothetical protein
MVKVRVKKPVLIDSQTVVGDDAGIEVRGSKLEVRVSSIHMRDSRRASTTTNVAFY